jgi:hypothetical protein
VAVHSQFLPGLFWPTVPSYIQRSGAYAPHKSYHTTSFWERNIYFLDALKQGAKQLLTMSLVGTPRCGVRSAQRADPNSKIQARLEEIPAALFVKFQCKECLTHDKYALQCQV